MFSANRDPETIYPEAAMTEKVTGIFAPLSTPFIDEEVSLAQLRENVVQYSRTPLAGFFALGSNGEVMSLDQAEKLKILETVLENKAPHQRVLAGAGCESTRATIALGKQVAALGADFVSVLTPSYFKKALSDDALVAHYTRVADALPVPVFIYNAPPFTGINLSPQVIGRLAPHANIAGMKDTSAGTSSRYLEVCGDDFTVLAGNAGKLFAALALGATGGVLSFADAFPQICCRLHAAFAAGDLEEARRLHYRISGVNRYLSDAFGVAGVKYAMDLVGFHGGPPRLPLLPLNAESRSAIRRVLNQAGLLP
jgi:4-hydroxy-2-oxoglutarate aldolase